MLKSVPHQKHSVESILNIEFLYVPCNSVCVKSSCFIPGYGIYLYAVQSIVLEVNYTSNDKQKFRMWFGRGTLLCTVLVVEGTAHHPAICELDIHVKSDLGFLCISIAAKIVERE